MNRILVALDVPTLGEATRLAKEVSEHVGGFKVGMELLMGAGPTAIETMADLGKPVFVDAKLHDIPNTVERAASRIASAGARWVTTHASGGQQMVEAAVSGMGGSGVLAVTMLTSLSVADLVSLGVHDGEEEYVTRMAAIASDAGAEGVVSSPGEIRAVKAGAPGLKVVTPGVRPGGSTTHDQKRVATPETARADGADYLVIGRPITNAAEPAEAAREIAATIARFG